MQMTALADLSMRHRGPAASLNCLLKFRADITNIDLKNIKAMVIKRTLLVACILCSIHLNALAQKNWRDINSVEEVCEYYPEVVKSLLNHIDLDHQGLEKVKAANSNGRYRDACKYLLDYYKNSNTAQNLRREVPVKTTKTDADADTILTNVFVIQNVRGQVVYGADGHRDWYYKGPNNDREWAWLSNRHSQLLQSIFNLFGDRESEIRRIHRFVLKGFYHQKYALSGSQGFGIHMEGAGGGSPGESLVSNILWPHQQ